MAIPAEDIIDIASAGNQDKERKALV